MLSRFTLSRLGRSTDVVADRLAKDLSIVDGKAPLRGQRRLWAVRKETAMNTTMDLSVLTSIVSLSEQFGPFLFSILFILVVPRIAQKYYREANIRTPPASDAEKNTYRIYFIGSVVCGILVMGASIGWWFFWQSQGTFVYQVAIVGLKEDQTIASQFFSKHAPRPAIPGTTGLHDDYFVLVQNQPFKVGDKFQFDFYKIPTAINSCVGAAGSVDPQKLEVVYDIPIQARFTQSSFELKMDGTTAKLVAADNEHQTRNLFSENEEIKVLNSQYADICPRPLLGRAYQ